MTAGPVRDRHDLLVELGCEEIPAADAREARRQLAERVGVVLAEQGLSYERVRTLGTPRRLTLIVRGLAARQEPREEWVRGPSRAVAYDADGQPTRAALGFAQSQGVPVADLVVRQTPQGEYVFARKVVEGRPAEQVLLQVLPDVLQSLEFRRTMRWGTGEHRFVRPVTWLVALLDDRVLPLSFAGQRAGRITYGHRFLHPQPIPLSTADEEVYRQRLADAGVVVDPEERRQRIVQQVQEAAAAAGGQAEMDDELLDEVVDLVEHPTAFAGSFAAEMLDLPRDVLVTTMQVHQRYFPVRRPDTGQLLPVFIGVRDGDRRHLDTVRRGNERVIRARLADARFFYDKDRQRPLAQRVAELERVSFLPGLGTLLDKTRRLERLVGWLADRLKLSDVQRQWAVRAAHLAKADLVTAVVFEFPELAGRMGREYALLSGEPPAVAQALAEQYGPDGDNRWPASIPGLLLAIADRADTLSGSFAAGLEPTGSQDPHGLRRAAVGLLKLLAGDPPGSLPFGKDRGASGSGEEGWPPLDVLLAEALAGYRPPAGPADLQLPVAPDQALEKLLNFLMARLRALLAEAGYTPEVIRAVLAVDARDIPWVWIRARAVTDWLATPLAGDVLTVHRRAANLAGRAPERPVDPGAFQEPEEQRLYQDLTAARAEVDQALARRDCGAYFRAVAGLRPAVDAFLERVLVMAEDPALRANRLALLREVAQLATRVAALGELGPAGVAGA